MQLVCCFTEVTYLCSCGSAACMSYNRTQCVYIPLFPSMVSSGEHELYISKLINSSQYLSSSI